MPSRLAPRLPLLRPLTAALTSGLAIFCAPASPQSPAPVHGPARPAESAACLVAPDSAGLLRNDTARIALTEPVDPAHVPIPVNDAERLLFRQMYQTLVRVDCEGQLVPGAAESWQSNDSGRSWSFHLGTGIHTWDGVPLTSADMVSGWKAAEVGESIVPLDHIDAPDEHTIRVTFRIPMAEPRMFASMRYAVIRPALVASASGWPLGTGPYRPDPAASGSLLRLVSADTAVHLPVLEVWQSAGGDPRDLLDRGADLLVTSDPALLDYAANRGDRTTAPLPWSRTFFLVMMQPVESLPRGLGPLADSVRAAEFRQTLARDAVRAESRAATPSPWDEARSCTELASSGPYGGPPVRSATRIVYLRGDQTARDLAERLVALTERRNRWSAVGLSAIEFRADLQMGSDRMFLVSGPRTDAAGCAHSGSSTSERQVLPLVDTRAHAILRRGSPAWVVDGDGTLRMPLPQDVAP